MKKIGFALLWAGRGLVSIAAAAMAGCVVWLLWSFIVDSNPGLLPRASPTIAVIGGLLFLAFAGTSELSKRAKERATDQSQEGFATRVTMVIGGAFVVLMAVAMLSTCSSRNRLSPEAAQQHAQDCATDPTC